MRLSKTLQDRSIYSGNLQKMQIRYFNCHVCESNQSGTAMRYVLTETSPGSRQRIAKDQHGIFRLRNKKILRRKRQGPSQQDSQLAMERRQVDMSLTRSLLDTHFQRDRSRLLCEMDSQKRSRLQLRKLQILLSFRCFDFVSLENFAGPKSHPLSSLAP